MLVRAQTTIIDNGKAYHAADEFNATWSQELAAQYQDEGLAVIIDAGVAPEPFVKPEPVPEVVLQGARLDEGLLSRLELLEARVERLEGLGKSDGSGGSDSGEPVAVPSDVQRLIDLEGEGTDLGPLLAGMKVDDLRAIANDMAIPNLHGKMTKAALVEMILEGLPAMRERGSDESDGSVG